jgi:hypothetical protein
MAVPFDFDDDDAVERTLEEQLRAFRAKFGRDPGPDDPLFFDPDADEPRALNRVAVEAGMVDAMEGAGISPAQIYAFQQTGIIPVEGLLDRAPAERLQEFYLAVRRYERLHLSAEENAEIDVAEAHETAVLAVAAMLEGDSETFREVFTEGGPLMKIVPLAWIRNARDNLPKNLYRRAMADGVDLAARTMPVPVRRAAGEWRSVMGTRPGAHPRPHDHIFDKYGIGDAIVALFCLACGLVRTVGRGDPHWLHNLDDDGQEHGHASIPADEADACIGEKILERLDSEPDLIRRAQQAAQVMGDLDRELAAELAELEANQHTLEAALAASRTTWPVLSDDAKRLVILYLIRRVTVGEPWLPLEQQIQITWRL